MASTTLFVASAFPSASVSAHENLKVLLVFVSVISLSITFCVLRNHGFCLSAEKMQENIMNRSFYFQFFFHFLGSGMAGCGGGESGDCVRMCIKNVEITLPNQKKWLKRAPYTSTKSIFLLLLR
jgi:hypothetical protein